ncbi:phosphotriesterase family protein [Haloplasma contractile]|uniref:Aryldialkylphosphatase protein n=1 Tax=Haloplasma contractile SSD-17B TaxID=1033810 RepID=U2FK81_9MOLU|nr:TatD family hydrolase [Haloplasma contractile]ERJ13220.1 Aryldialkylphosphatase protein [Haloplasma contractile SSD-17B]
MIYTVNGVIEKEELGLCLSHEHLAWDSRYATFNYFYKTYDQHYTEAAFQKILPLFNRLYELGCRAIVEASPPRGGQNLLLMKKLSDATGIHMIASTGLPFTRSVYEVHKTFNPDELVSLWVRDFKEGLDIIGDVVIKPNQIKVLLGDDCGPGVLEPTDEKILRAAIRASKQTGLPVHCHLLEAETAQVAFKIIEDEHANYDRFLWAHIAHEDEPNLEVIHYAMKKGIWLGLDQIRPENYKRYFMVLNELIQNNYTHKILLSQDYDFLEEINEKGLMNPCTSILTDFMSYCEQRGVSKTVINKILTKNPANFFNLN